MDKQEEKVSVVVLAFNAPRYCRITINTLQRTKDVNYETIVVDNNSRWITKLYLFWAFAMGKINRLCFLDRNTMFSGGNNIGVALSSSDSTHVVLLNSDVEIRDELWLRKLLNLHNGGVSAYGYVEGAPEVPARADGYCFLINKELYDRYELNEDFKWWWGLTELQAKLLRDGYGVQAIDKHDHILFHFGGKSGTRHLKTDQRNFKMPDVKIWFEGQEVVKIDTVP
jgi:GT2 family glycosyltransferase